MINVNLLRPEKKEVAVGEKPVSYVEEAKERALSVPSIVAALAVSLGTIGLLFFLQSGKLASERKTLEERRLRKEELQRVLQKLAEVEATKKALDQKIKLISDLKSRQKDTVRIMDKLSSCLPEWVWLTSFSCDNLSLKIAGKAMSNNLISDFIGNLKSSTYFSVDDTKLSSVSGREGLTEFYAFTLSLTYIRPAEDLNKGV